MVFVWFCFGGVIIIIYPKDTVNVWAIVGSLAAVNSLSGITLLAVYFENHICPGFCLCVKKHP